MARKIDDVTQKLEQAKVSAADSSAEYFPLKMIEDKKTEMYVKFAKVMVIIQGKYPKEREKLAAMIEETFKYTSCVITDEKYSIQTNMPCSFEKAEEFYKYFKDTAREALEVGNNLLVIDSTVSNIVQNRYYVALAYKMQYVILVVPPVVTSTSRCFWPKRSLADSFRREAKTVILPTNMFQHLFCAWYLHDVDSHQLRDYASLYIQDCLEEIPEFKSMMDKHCSKIGPDGEELSLVDAVRQYYCLTDQRQDVAFCALKIIGNSLKMMNDYFKKPSVQKTFGKMSKIYIAGFIISPVMIAARVKLTHHQKDLWEIEEEMNEAAVDKSDFKPIGPLKLLQDLKKELPDDVDVRLIASKSNQSLINSGQTVHEPLENIPHFAKGRACHIVLGKAAGANSHHVDFGVQFALSREHKAMKEKADLPIYELKNCVAKRFGKYWFVYLRENLRVDGFFASCVKPFSFDHAISC